MSKNKYVRLFVGSRRTLYTEHECEASQIKIWRTPTPASGLVLEFYHVSILQTFGKKEGNIISRTNMYKISLYFKSKKCRNFHASIQSTSKPNCIKQRYKLIETKTNLKSPCCKFNSNGGFWFQTKLVSGKPRQYIRFSNSRISNQDNFE